MNREKVKNLYALGHAHWYDFFKKAWNRLVVVQAERDLTVFLQKNMDKTKNILDLGGGTALNLEKIVTLDLKFKEYTGLIFPQTCLKLQKIVEIIVNRINLLLSLSL